MNIFWVFNHPAPYKVALHEELSHRVEGLTAVYERSSEGDRNKDWYLKRKVSYEAICLKALPLGPHNAVSLKLPSIYRRKKYDIVVVNGYSTVAEMVFIDYLRRHGIPYVFAINGGIAKSRENPIKEKVKRHYISGASLYLAPDENSVSYLLHYGADKKKIRLYPYSTVYEKDVLEKPLTKEEKRAGWKADPLSQGRLAGFERVYVAVGSFIERKNNTRLLELWKKARHDYALVLIGDGPEERKYRSFIEKNGIGNVFIYPFLSHPETLKRLSYADMSIFLTKEDIYGHVVNESLSQGTPVIASRHANASLKLIENGSTGYLLEDEEDDTFLAAVNASADGRMPLECLKKARENTIEKMADRHYEIFKEYLGDEK